MNLVKMYTLCAADVRCRHDSVVSPIIADKCCNENSKSPGKDDGRGKAGKKKVFYVGREEYGRRKIPAVELK